MSTPTSTTIILTALSLVLPACGGGADSGDRAGNEPGKGPRAPAAVPEPVDSGAACIISADCPAGAHCDLGECIQDCNTERACEKRLVCSARGRCIEPDAVDADPPPVTEYAGTIAADPRAAELTELDDSFELKLSSDAGGPVEYRVELRAPFLRLDDAERGAFEGSTTLRFAVDPAGLSGTVTPGTILVHTSLGDVVVSPSLRVGLTGRYHGVLRYTAGKAPLGEVGIALDMVDEHGDVSVRIDPERSLTFPETSAGFAAGRGIFTHSQGLSVSVGQVLDESFGGARNHFRRPVGRRVSFSLNPIGGGRLEGSFEEQIHGLLERPIEISGTVYLEPAGEQLALSFEVPEVPAMPAPEAGVYPSIDAFPSWAPLGCPDEIGCTVRSFAGVLSCVENTVEPTYYEPLVASLSGVRTDADPFDFIAQDCQSELAITSREEYLASPRRCALIAPLACSLNRLATIDWPGELLPRANTAFNRVFARTLAPALLVAQNHIVQGLKESFVKGLSTQAERFARAREALETPAAWVLTTGLLEHLRALPVEVAEGEEASDDPTRSDYPAARALARLLYVLHTLDGEQARADAMDIVGTRADKLARAQERGVLGFLEAAALAAVLEGWGNPPNIGNEFVGSLTLSDRGFTALHQGALVFGVPEGEVPLMYDASRAAPTNFEQVLELRAGPALEQFELDQAAFQSSSREFEQNASRLQDELESVRLGYDTQIMEVCGPGFDLDAIQSDADWARCGADGAGEYAELTLDIEQANLRLQASESRLSGMETKIEVDQRRLAATQELREEQILFIDRSGKELNALTVQEGLINQAQIALEIASNSSFWNAGAPLAMAAAAALMEGMRTQIQVAREQLQTAQQMKAAELDQAIEYVNGMAEIQKQLIDSAQLQLEMQQDALAVVQADLRRRNAVDRAKRAFEERARSLARISSSPLADPTFRILQTQLALQAVHSRAEAQRWLYRAARALEYEINTPLGEALPRAVLGAYDTAGATRLSNCLKSILNDYSAKFGIPQEFTTTVSVREMLGITGPRKDEVTGEQLSPGELFRRAILKNENLGPDGAVTVTFSTNLQPGNELWSTNVCDDKIVSTQAQLVGDFQGDDEAEIQIALSGGGVMRRCDSEELINWSIDGAAPAVLQAGVNGFGDTKPNTSLFGQSVARPTWTIVIPSGLASPANADIDLTTLEDIVLRITHEALPRRTAPIPIDVSCLGSVGAGG